MLQTLTHRLCGMYHLEREARLLRQGPDVFGHVRDHRPGQSVDDFHRREAPEDVRRRVMGVEAALFEAKADVPPYAERKERDEVVSHDMEVRPQVGGVPSEVGLRRVEEVLDGAPVLVHPVDLARVDVHG